jgi:hypothetical protein
MIRLSGQTLSETLHQSNISISSGVLPFFPWKVEVVGYKTYNIDHLDCPIVGGGFSVGTYGMGKASLRYSYFDIPIDPLERVRIYYKGEKFYEGFINGEPDIKDDKVDILPNWERMKQLLFNKTYTATDVDYKTVIQDVIEQVDDKTGILFNQTFLQFDSTFVFSTPPSYDYANAKTVITDIEKQIDNVYAGADQDNFYYVKQFSTSINHFIYYNDEPPYINIKTKVDDNRIKATKNQVYQKSTILNDNIRIGQVGYDVSTGSYPALTTIEQRVGQKEKKFTAPEGLTDSEALNFAYNKLVSETDIPTNIKITGLDYSRYPLRIGEKIKVWTPELFGWRNIVEVETTTGWKSRVEKPFIGGVDDTSIIDPTQLSTDAKKGNFSFRFSGKDTSVTLISGAVTPSTVVYANFALYEFSGIQEWANYKRIGFYIKSDKLGNIIDFSIAETIGGYSLGGYSSANYSIGSTEGISINNTNYTWGVPVDVIGSWQFVSFPIENIDNFKYLYFKSNDTDAKIKIDDIKLLGYYQKTYEANVRELTFDLTSNLVNVEAGEFDENLNDEFFELNKEVKALQETLQG